MRAYDEYLEALNVDKELIALSNKPNLAIKALYGDIRFLSKGELISREYYACACKYVEREFKENARAILKDALQQQIDERIEAAKEALLMREEQLKEFMTSS
jgi:hypothetical protein